MRIAIDARLNAYRRGGIPEYTRQLVTALAPLSRADTFITLQHREHFKPLVVAPNVRRRAVFTPPHHRFEQLALPAELLPLRPDLLHCPDFVVPLRRPFPAVATIHDLAFLHFPEILDDDARRYYGRVRASAHSAEAVIAVSQATRDDIVRLLDLPAERVDVVYEAASPEFGPPGPDDERERAFGGHWLRAGEFALFVSTLEPRKNLPTLLHALRVCRDRRPEAGYLLAVAGARGWRYQAIFDAVREHELEDSVLFLGSMSGEELRWLYGHCRLYLNPSRYEGFGLPVLEALACGAPALVANTSSLPEIVGEAAPLLPPDDAEAWADAIEALWHDEARRAALSAAGPPQAARFSWRAAAEQTLAIYRRVVAGRAASPTDAPAPADAPAQPTVVLSTNGAARHAERAPDEPAGVIVVSSDGAEPVAPVDGNAVIVVAADSAATLRDAATTALVATLPRACLRCGAPQRAGTLEAATWRADGEPEAAYEVQAWACTQCGTLDLRLGAPLAAPAAPPAQSVEELSAAMDGGQTPGEAAAPAAPPAQSVEELAAAMGTEQASSEAAPPPAPPIVAPPAKQRGRRADAERKPADSNAPGAPAKQRRSGRKGG